MPLLTGSNMDTTVQEVLREIKNYATTPIRGALGQTSAQGRALLGMGEITGGLQKEEMSNAAAERRLGISETGAMARAKLSESGATERAKLSGDSAYRQAKVRSDALGEISRSPSGRGLDPNTIAPLPQITGRGMVAKASPGETPPVPAQGPSWWEPQSTNVLGMAGGIDWNANSRSKIPSTDEESNPYSNLDLGFE